MKRGIRQSPPYLISYACLDCHKSFKRHFVAGQQEMKCPHCGSVAHNVGRKFKSPKRADDGQWEKVAFLIRNGFPFHSIYDDHEQVPYPKTLAEAKEFVKKFKDKAVQR